MAVSAEVTVDDPLSLLHSREVPVLGEPVYAVTSLAKDKRILLLLDSLLVLISWQERLTLEKLEILEDLATEAVVDSVVDEVVSAVSSKLLDQIDLDHKRHCVLGNETSRLSDNFDVFVLTWELLLENLVDLGSDLVEVLLGISGAHGEATSDVKDFHGWHSLFLGHFEDALCVVDRLAVFNEAAAS